MIIQTSEHVEWKNAYTNELPYGKSVLALTRAGKLIETVWTRDTINTCDAYMDYPKIPSDIRALQNNRINRQN